MKTGYIIIHETNKQQDFVVVSNYQKENEIYNWAFFGPIEICRSDKTKSDIGIWKIKQLKSI